MDRLAAIDRFWHAANYVSAAMLYLRSNPMLRRPLASEDVKPRALGHWGCVPGLNFIWANLLAAIRATGADVRLFFGTGHAGPAWLSCSYLEGSLARYHEIAEDESGLAALVASFGRSGGFTTELSAQYPGVLWPAGELGYALAIAHGHSASAKGAWTVVVLGDGELETAPTAGAFQALRKFAGHAPRLIVIVNCNGYRMGGPSEIASWTDGEVHRHFGGLGLSPRIVDGFDAETVHATLRSWMSEPEGVHAARLLLLRTPKGATIPALPGDITVEGTARSHKPPLKKLRTSVDLAWLEEWLRSYRVEDIFGAGTLDRRPFGAILPPEELLPGTAWDRISWQQQDAPSAPERAPDSSATATFVECVRASAGKPLLTSPDELASNRLEGLSRGDVEVVEYLSEHQCMSWSIGAASAGRPTWFTSYDAFAPIVGSMVTQHLKFLDSAAECHVPLRLRPVNLFLTSLGWRNVYSHQDPSFASSVLEKHFETFRCFLPASTEAMAAAVQICGRSQNSVNCVIADKYVSEGPRPATRLTCGLPFVEESTGGERTNSAPSARIYILAAGDYVVSEALRAAQAIQLSSNSVTARVIVLEELSWLYRDCSESRVLRADLSRRLSGATACVLATSLYAGVLSSLVTPLVPTEQRLAAFGFRSGVAPMTALGALVGSGCSWMQLAASSLEIVAEATVGSVADEAMRASTELRDLEQKIRKELLHRYEDPHWYHALKPAHLLGDGKDKTSDSA